MEEKCLEARKIYDLELRKLHQAKLTLEKQLEFIERHFIILKVFIT